MLALCMGPALTTPQAQDMPPPLEPYCKLAAYNIPKVKTCHQISLTTNKHILTYRPAILHSEKLEILVITSIQLQPSLAT